MKSNKGAATKKEIFAGPSFNDMPDMETLPIPTIPDGFTVKMQKEKKPKAKKQKAKAKKAEQKNK
ncbi:hypothetical protein NEAUS04_1065 [Nematocida ausubeli]|uniref:Uncharacterized protein n=1 Tax=Nematocida ausubeli (strain ATCC PRA-371 / ERTm2) TaxID=1913371 RepID=H8Z8X4_NEMA1|nr:uncharacterized protein NESG_01037 [Nematocida ausubeli]EHY66405.1 hypothetical protein NERG_00045 [Nematocida ausubeli]KAI5132303.1 hypothetical protein NEAUS07_0065 [Nematocida ausubeli]KAI5135654.1 hypothetical protein NEAUS06_1581 [Nematocida ausubeli]KAI5162620.1 hypothetical protein NEAUS04_1065 [Nematocida ausubeli]KFG26881.1 hypothetical protein NESG_01037 [Nematocida ausubeli]